MKTRLLLPLFLLFGALLSACASASTPIMIGSYPSGSSRNPSSPGYSESFIYDGDLELEVSSVSSAARQAENLAYDLGGYLSSSSSWKQQGHTFTTLVLCVPADNFETLYNRLLRLGDLVSDDVNGKWASGYGQGFYSQITLTLRPGAYDQSGLPSTGWNPLHTFEQALGVFLRIFGFIVDVLIWVLVLGGPFLLIVLLLRRLVRRLRRGAAARP